MPSRREGTLPERVLDALDLIDDFVMELTRVREILEPLAALHPNDGFWRGLSADLYAQITDAKSRVVY